MASKQQKGNAPKQGAIRRDRSTKSNVTGTSRSYAVGGSITRRLWGKLTGWDNPGRQS